MTTHDLIVQPTVFSQTIFSVFHPDVVDNIGTYETIPVDKFLMCSQITKKCSTFDDLHKGLRFILDEYNVHLNTDKLTNQINLL